MNRKILFIFILIIGIILISNFTFTKSISLKNNIISIPVISGVPKSKSFPSNHAISIPVISGVPKSKSFPSNHAISIPIISGIPKSKSFPSNHAISIPVISGVPKSKSFPSEHEISIPTISGIPKSKSFPSEHDISIPVISGIPKLKPPISKSYCSGSICLPPGETPASMNLNHLSTNSSRELSTTTIDNKMGTASHEGSYHIPVLLVNFPDLQQPPGMTSDIFNDIYNSPNYLDGNGTSVREFYLHNSYGALDVTYDIYDWRQAPQDYNFYVQNTYQLVVDTMNLFGTGSDPVDFTQYDYNGDGRIDGVVIVHAGLGDQDIFGENIVTETMIFKINPSTIQGMLYGDTAIVPSNQGPGPLTSCTSWLNDFNYPEDCRLSTEIAVHEFAHVLGLPDLYSINYAGVQQNKGLGGHTVMVQGSDAIQDPKKPINFDPWSKYFFGWIHPTLIDDVNQSGIYSLGPFDTTDDAYILHNPNTMSAREFYLIVNRYTGKDSYDYYLFGKGMSLPFNELGGIDILHVDENYIDNTYCGPIAFNSIMYDPDNNYYLDETTHPGLRIEQNDLDQFATALRNTTDLYTSDTFINPNCSHTLFRGIYDNVARTDANYPCQRPSDTTSYSYNGLVDSGVRVQGVSESASTVFGYFAITTDLISFIASPLESRSYPYKEPIDFNAGYFNTQGDVSCEWSSGGTVISNECNFSASPFDLGLSGPYTFTANNTSSVFPYTKNRALRSLSNLPSSITKDITLTVTDDNSSYTTSMELKICLCGTKSYKFLKK